MANPFSEFSDAVDAPARNVFLITPSDTAELPIIPTAVRADSSGVMVFRTIGAIADVTMNVSAGETLPYRVQFVRQTGTTVTTIHGLAIRGSLFDLGLPSIRRTSAHSVY